MFLLCFSPHPIYRNTSWPNSYLIHPLSVVPVRLTCLIAYTDTSPLCNHKPTYPLDRLAWLQPSPATNSHTEINHWFHTVLGPQSPHATLASKSPEITVFSAHSPLTTSPNQKAAHAPRTIPKKKLRRRSLPIPTLKPTLTCEKAHDKLSTIRNNMKHIRQVAQDEAAKIVSDIIKNRPKEFTTKSANNPMIIRHTPESIGLAKRVKLLIPEPVFSHRS